MKKHKNILLLMMGGKGTRFKNDIPKQFSFVNGLPIYLYILRRYNVMKNIDHIVIVTNPDYLEKTKEWNRFVESEKGKGTTFTVTVTLGESDRKGVEADGAALDPR